jgi:virulence-associated protein VapD
MIEKNISYCFSFDLNTNKLLKYTHSKNLAYYEIKKFLVNELGFIHIKDSDYITPKISKTRFNIINNKIIGKFIHIFDCFNKFQATEVDKKNIDILEKFEGIIDKNPELKQELQKVRKDVEQGLACDHKNIFLFNEIRKESEEERFMQENKQLKETINEKDTEIKKLKEENKKLRLIN